MLSEFIRKANILLRKKSDVYAIIVIDEKSLKYNKEKVDQQTEKVRL